MFLNVTRVSDAYLEYMALLIYWLLSHVFVNLLAFIYYNLRAACVVVVLNLNRGSFIDHSFTAIHTLLLVSSVSKGTIGSNHAIPLNSVFM